MTYEAELAKDVGYKFECKKDALRQNQDGSWKATLNIHPEEMSNQFLSDTMGQRYVCVIVPINDDETPKEKKKSFAQQAVLMCRDDEFHRYVIECRSYGERGETKEDTCKHFLQYECEIQSRSELIEGTEKARKFKRLQAEYLQWKGYE